MAPGALINSPCYSFSPDCVPLSLASQPHCKELRHRTHTHTHVYTYSHAHTHTHTRTRTPAHAYARMHTRTYAHTHAYARTHAHTHTHTHTHRDTNTHAHATRVLTHTRACEPNHSGLYVIDKYPSNTLQHQQGQCRPDAHTYVGIISSPPSHKHLFRRAEKPLASACLQKRSFPQCCPCRNIYFGFRPGPCQWRPDYRPNTKGEKLARGLVYETLAVLCDQIDLLVPGAFFFFFFSGEDV